MALHGRENKTSVRIGQFVTMPRREPRKAFRLGARPSLRRQHQLSPQIIGRDGNEGWLSECWPLWLLRRADLWSAHRLCHSIKDKVLVRRNADAASFVWMEWTNGRKRVGGNTAEESMSQPERYDVLVLGSGFGGKLIAWHMAQSGRRTAVVERRWIGGSCPNIACLPSKNVIRSAEVAHLAPRNARYP
jgi:hypothetical protein